MAYSDQQIKDYAMQLQQRGASPADIEAFVSGAKGQTTQSPTAQSPLTSTPPTISPNMPSGVPKSIFGQPIMGAKDTSSGDSAIASYLTNKAPGSKLGQGLGISIAGGVTAALKFLKGNFSGGMQELKTTAKQINDRGPGIVGDTIKSMALPASFAAAPTTIGGMVGTGAITGGVLSGSQALEENKSAGDIAKDTSVGTVLGSGLGALGYGLGALVNKFGNKAIMTGLRPTEADYKNGFSLDTIKKFNLGGNLPQMYAKTDATLDSLSKQLQEKLASNPTAVVDMDKAYTDTVKRLTTDKFKNFLQNNKIGNAVQVLRGEIDSLMKGTNGDLTPDATDLAKSFISNATAQLDTNGSTDIAKAIRKINPNVIQSFDDLKKAVGSYASNPDVANWLKTTNMLFKNYIDTPAVVSIPNAQLMKRAAQHLGAWQYGRTDPESSALETVANTFSNVLKTEIEKNSPKGVQEINKDIGELIPVMNAIIRRIPVAERNGILSLTDMLSLIGASFNPSVLGLGLVNLASKSARFGNFAANKLAPAIEKTAPAIGGITAGATTNALSTSPLPSGQPSIQ